MSKDIALLSLNSPRSVCLFPARAVRPVAAALLLILGFCVCGVPIPVGFVSKPSQERFPCEKCPCGCVSARHCWDKCCCHTDQEKLAWARRNNVTPPAFLVLRANRDQRSRRSLTREATSSQHCSTGKGCCSASQIEDHHAPSNIASQRRPANKPIDHSSRIVLLDAVAKCQGHNLGWQLLQHGWSGIVEPMDLFTLPEPPLVGWIFFGDETAPSAIHVPDGPVPKPVSYLSFA